MVVQISSQLEAKIEQLMETGEFSSREDVLAKAVGLLVARERKLARLRAELAIADEQLERGEFIEYTPDYMKQKLANARERSRLGLPIKDVVKP